MFGRTINPTIAPLKLAKDDDDLDDDDEEWDDEEWEDDGEDDYDGE